MSADDDVKADSRGIQIERMKIVQDIEQNTARTRNGRVGQRLGPFSFVNIPAHGNHRCQFFQSGKNLRLSYIAGMENQLRTAQLLQGLWTQ